MSHMTMQFLVQAENLDTAIRKLNNSLDSENSFFDYFNIIENESGTLEARKSVLNEILAEHDYLVKAEQFIKEAEELRRKKIWSSAGHFYTRAGALYAEELSDDMPYYNITDWTYDIPADLSGWYLIPVDFHF